MILFLVLAIVLPTDAVGRIMAPQSSWPNVLSEDIGVFILLAIGLNVVVGQAGMLDLGYVAFYAVGGYALALLATRHHWDFWVILPLGIAIAALSGLILGAPTLRLRGDYLAIVTLGFGQIISISANNFNFDGGPQGVSTIPHPPSIGHIKALTYGVIDFKPYFYLVLAAIFVAVFLVRRLEHSRVGRAWMAIREDEDVAELMGVPTYRFRLWAFAFGAALGGSGGVFFAAQANHIDPTIFSYTVSILVLAAVVLGGSGNLAGVILGAFMVAWLPGTLPGLRHLPGPDIRGGAGRHDDLPAAGAAAVSPAPGRDRRSRRRQWLERGPAAPLGRGRPVSDPARGNGPSSDPATQPSRPRDAQERPVLLELERVTIRFGGVVAISELDLVIRQGEIFGLIGPNGAGKTSTFNIITGVYQPTDGTVRFAGQVLGKRKPHKITRLGVARTFQNIRLFPEMSALENVMVGADARHGTGIPGALLGLPRHRREEREGVAVARDLLNFVGILGAEQEAARNLPYGDQRRLEIARALATAPKLLLLDEPAAGMNPAEKLSLAALIRAIRDRGITVLLIEHDMGLVMTDQRPGGRTRLRKENRRGSALGGARIARP